MPSSPRGRVSCWKMSPAFLTIWNALPGGDAAEDVAGGAALEEVEGDHSTIGLADADGGGAGGDVVDLGDVEGGVALALAEDGEAGNGHGVVFGMGSGIRGGGGFDFGEHPFHSAVMRSRESATPMSSRFNSMARLEFSYVSGRSRSPEMTRWRSSSLAMSRSASSTFFLSSRRAAERASRSRLAALRSSRERKTFSLGAWRVGGAGAGVGAGVGEFLGRR